MNYDHLGFVCPRCGANLVVPATAAGAEGPCPKCGGTIRAPRLAARPEETPVRLEVTEELVVKAKPVVTAFQPAAELPLIESTAMRASRKASIRRTLTTALIVLGVATILTWVVVARNQKPPTAPRVGAAQPPVPAPVEEGPAGPDLRDPSLDPRVPPVGLDVQAFVARSAEVLGAFLTARNLEERMPLLESATSREELEKTCLAGPLGASGKFESLEVKFDKVIGANEVLFKVTFKAADIGMDDYLILVRTRGSQPPKIAVEPFLDTYGGRFAAFAAAPREGQGKFRAVATVFEFCSDDTIPGHELKYTMKVSVTPGAADLAKVYFGKSSPLREKLDKLGVRYGHGAAATVTVRWNTDGKPFLEAVDVLSLDWSE